MPKTSQATSESGQDRNVIRILSDDKFQKLQTQAIAKPKRTKDDWRSIFALIILSGYFILITIIVIAWLAKKDIDSVIKILSSIGSLLGSPLGFVIGYYYKDRSK